MVWFVMSETSSTPLGSYAFQTKLTYGMICYSDGQV